MAQWAKHFISQHEKLLQFPKPQKASAKITALLQAGRKTSKQDSSKCRQTTKGTPSQTR